MRRHPHVAQEVTFTDLQQIAMTRNHYLCEEIGTNSHEKIYSILPEKNLFTFQELKELLMAFEE